MSPRRPAREGTGTPLILLVDDEYGILEALAELLRAEGFRVVSAGNGREALQQLAVETPDVCLVDVMMPEMNGVALVEAMAADAQLRDIPVVMMSAATNAVPPPIRQRLRILRKPFQIDALLGVLRETIGRGSVAQR